MEEGEIYIWALIVKDSAGTLSLICSSSKIDLLLDPEFPLP
jgi:hypothetical protein